MHSPRRPSASEVIAAGLGSTDRSRETSARSRSTPVSASWLFGRLVVTDLVACVECSCVYYSPLPKPLPPEAPPGRPPMPSGIVSDAPALLKDGATSPPRIDRASSHRMSCGPSGRPQPGLARARGGATSDSGGVGSPAYRTFGEWPRKETTSCRCSSNGEASAGNPPPARNAGRQSLRSERSTRGTSTSEPTTVRTWK